MRKWSGWKRFPDPRKGELLIAPFGPGCYDIRRGSQPVTPGEGKNVVSRMTSLLPRPLGAGTRKNSKKRRYILEHLSEIEFRTLACADKRSAVEAQRKLKEEVRRRGDKYLYPR
jgi:hypothetical protein